MNCFRSCAGSAGFTTSTPGGPPKSAMWVKSRSGSNGKVFESAGAIQCVATPETTSVYPSSAALATNSEPMTPPAPARFSTMKFSFKVSLSLCDTRRPRVSAVPPGAKGTTMRTVLAGQLCASASGPPSSRATSTAALGPKCRAGCEIDASIGVILPEHRAKIAVRPPRGLCATYRNGKSHGNHRRTTDPLAAGRGLARAERSRGLEGVHRGLRSDRKSFRYRVPRRHGGVGGARESQVQRKARALRSQPAEFLFPVLRGIGRRGGIRQGQRAGFAQDRRRGHAPDLLRQGERRRQARAGRLAADRRGREKNGRRLLRGVQREARRTRGQARRGGARVFRAPYPSGLVGGGRAARSAPRLPRAPARALTLAPRSPGRYPDGAFFEAAIALKAGKSARECF